MPRLIIGRRPRGLAGYLVRVVTRPGLQGRIVVCAGLPEVWRVSEHHYNGHAYIAPGCPECARRARKGGDRG